MTRSWVSALAVAAALVLGVAGCSNGSTATAVEQAAPGRVGAAEFAEVISEPGVAIIDVRTPEEFAEGHIIGAVNIPVQSSDFAARVATLDPNGTYAVYCRSGNRSQPAVAQMKAAGITRIYELADGTKGWTAADQPLTK